MSESIEAKAARVIQKARATIVLDHPFFASPMLKKKMTPDASVRTLCVNAAGHIKYSPAFIASLTTPEAVFAIVHEVLHYLSGHALRIGNRDPQRWNVAGDMWINDTLKAAGFTIIKGCIDVPGSASKTVEALYDEMPEDDESNGDGDDADGSTGQGQDPMGSDIDPHGDEGETLSESDRAEAEAQRKLDVAEAAQVARMKGKLPGVLAEFASATIDSKVPWFDILERYMTERIKNDYSWARPNRRYAPDFYLPTIDGVGAMGEVVIQVDVSGSVSPREIEHYNGHIKGILEQCRPSKVHVIYTDTRVQKHEVFDKPEDAEIKFYSGGGTDMRAGFDYIDKEGIEPEVVITLTDGYTPFPAHTPFPSIWCISNQIESPIGETIHFTVT